MFESLKTIKIKRTIKANSELIKNTIKEIISICNDEAVINTINFIDNELLLQPLFFSKELIDEELKILDCLNKILSYLKEDSTSQLVDELIITVELVVKYKSLSQVDSRLAKKSKAAKKALKDAEQNAPRMIELDELERKRTELHYRYQALVIVRERFPGRKDIDLKISKIISELHIKSAYLHDKIRELRRYDHLGGVIAAINTEDTNKKIKERMSESTLKGDVSIDTDYLDKK